MTTIAQALAAAEKDPRVITARDRLARGEITKQRVYQIVHEAAGLCRSCSRTKTKGAYCDEHQPEPGRSKPRTEATRHAENERNYQRRREARGLGPGLPLGRGGPGLPRTCKRCLQVGHFAKTCKAVVEEVRS